MRVLITRPPGQAGDWVDALRAQGLDAHALPLITTRAVADASALHAAWQALPRWDALMFVSANAIDVFFGAQPPGTALVPPAPRCWVTGPGSRAALLRHGVAAAQVDAPSAEGGQFDSEALWQVVAPQVRPGLRVLVVRGQRAAAAAPAGGAAVDRGRSETGAGRDWLAQRLGEREARVDFLVAYERGLPHWDADAQALARSGATGAAIWVFSASEAVEHLQRLLPGQAWSDGRCLCTHPRIAEAARTAGFGVVYESRPDLPSVVRSLKSLA